MQLYQLINHRGHINHLFFSGNHQNPLDFLSLVALCSNGSHFLGKLMFIIKQVIELYDNYKVNDRSLMFNYFVDKKLKNLMEVIREF